MAWEQPPQINEDSRSQGGRASRQAAALRGCHRDARGLLPLLESVAPLRCLEPGQAAAHGRLSDPEADRTRSKEPGNSGKRNRPRPGAGSRRNPLLSISGGRGGGLTCARRSWSQARAMGEKDGLPTSRSSTRRSERTRSSAPRRPRRSCRSASVRVSHALARGAAGPDVGLRARSRRGR
jgi:hypothetical protein